MIDIFRDTFKSLFSKRTLLIWAIATIGATLAGPFGTFGTMSFGLRALYWPLITTTSILLGYLAHACARVMVGPSETASVQLASACLGTIFVTTDVWIFRDIFTKPDAASLTYQSLMGHVGFVFMAVVVVRLVLLQVHQPQSVTPADSAPNFEPDVEPDFSENGPRLLRRLPAHIGAQILRLTADNHFVEVVCSNGAVSLRMRFRDAIDELDGIAGSVVHRSHWVAHEAISGVEKIQGKLVLRLQNGDEVPVSRSYRAELEAANIPSLPRGQMARSEASDRSQ